MGMFAGMHIWRTIAAECNAAFLASAQVHPAIVCFYTFLTHVRFGVFQGFNCLKVFADFVFHLSIINSYIFQHSAAL